MGCCCRKLTDAEKAALPECRKNLRSDSFPSEASNRTRCARCCACFASNIKFLLLFVATLGGAVLGYFLSDLGPFREPRLNPRIMLYFTFYAEVVTRILRFLALPVMVASLVSGVASLTTRISVKTAVIIGVYYAVTSIIATAEGFLWVFVFGPSRRGGEEDDAGAAATPEVTPEAGHQRHELSFPDVIMDLVRNVFPDNFLTVTFETYHTNLMWKEMHPKNLTNETIFVETFDLAPTRTPNLLGLAVWLSLFGIFLTALGRQRAKPVCAVFDAVFAVTQRMYLACLWLYPLAVVLLVARLTLEMSDPLARLRAVSRLLVAVSVGLAAHALIVLPVALWLLTRRNPLAFLFGVGRALVTALASGDSLLTLPVTLSCLERGTRIHSAVARYAAPVGAVFNKDGAAVYQVIVTAFFARYRGIEDDPIELLAMGCVSVGLTFGASHIRDSIIVHAVLFHLLGLPTVDLILLLPVHWILERLRVVVGVWSDCVGAAIADKLCKGDMELLQYRNSQYRLLKYDAMDAARSDASV